VRTRKEIEHEAYVDGIGIEALTLRRTKLTLEVLLDIRELIIKELKASGVKVK